MEQEKRLHILRIRARGDDAFYDPQADFRGILPNVMQMALDDLKVADRGEDPDTYLYLEK